MVQPVAMPLVVELWNMNKLTEISLAFSYANRAMNLISGMASSQVQAISIHFDFRQWRHNSKAHLKAAATVPKYPSNYYKQLQSSDLYRRTFGEQNGEWT